MSKSLFYPDKNTSRFWPGGGEFRRNKRSGNEKNQSGQKEKKNRRKTVFCCDRPVFHSADGGNIHHSQHKNRKRFFHGENNLSFVVKFQLFIQPPAVDLYDQSKIPRTGRKVHF